MLFKMSLIIKNKSKLDICRQTFGNYFSLVFGFFSYYIAKLLFCYIKVLIFYTTKNFYFCKKMSIINNNTYNNNTTGENNNNKMCFTFTPRNDFLLYSLKVSRINYVFDI